MKMRTLDADEMLDLFDMHLNRRHPKVKVGPHDWEYSDLYFECDRDNYWKDFENWKEEIEMNSKYGHEEKI